MRNVDQSRCSPYLGLTDRRCHRQRPGRRYPYQHRRKQDRQRDRSQCSSRIQCRRRRTAEHQRAGAGDHARLRAHLHASSIRAESSILDTANPGTRRLLRDAQSLQPRHLYHCSAQRQQSAGSVPDQRAAGRAARAASAAHAGAADRRLGRAARRRGRPIRFTGSPNDVLLLSVRSTSTTIPVRSSRCATPNGRNARLEQRAAGRRQAIACGMGQGNYLVEVTHSGSAARPKPSPSVWRPKAARRSAPAASPRRNSCQRRRPSSCRRQRPFSSRPQHLSSCRRQRLSSCRRRRPSSPPPRRPSRPS